jgi:hypothetical protein
MHWSHDANRSTHAAGNQPSASPGTIILRPVAQHQTPAPTAESRPGEHTAWRLVRWTAR